MKNLCSMLFMLLLLGQLSAQNLIFENKEVTPGETINITYNPEGTAFEDGTEFNTTAYLFIEGDRPEAHTVDMKLKDGLFRGSFKSTPETKLIYVKVANNEKELKDDNERKGYGLKMKKDGKAVAGAYGYKGLAYGTLNRFANIEANRAKGIKLLMKEFDLHPESANNYFFLFHFANLARAEKDKAALAFLDTKREDLLNAKKDEEKWMAAYQISRNLKEEAKMEEIAEKLRKKFPKGQMLELDLVNDFYATKDVEKRAEVYGKYRKMCSTHKKFETNNNNMARTLASKYGSLGDYEKMDQYAAFVTDKRYIAGIYNSVAWPLTGESLEGEAKDIEVANRISGKSVAIMEALLKTPEAGKPSHYTTKEWESNLDFTRGMYADTYALTLYKMGNYEEGFKYQKIACETDKFKDGSMNRRYGVFLEKLKGEKVAEIWLEKMIRKGNANSAMKERHRELFLANNTLETVYDKYIVELEKEAQSKKLEELEKKMMKKKSPEFSLVNLKGEKVTTADLKGKVVVVDFWATWCGPCKASFPGMQKALNLYEGNEEVAFVFIDTWESAKNKEENASKFINKNGYTFNVLMDNESKVVGQFGVEGIPTKFVLDKEGYIRFKSVGFGGNDDELVTELQMMINLAGANGGQPGADD